MYLWFRLVYDSIQEITAEKKPFLHKQKHSNCIQMVYLTLIVSAMLNILGLTWYKETIKYKIVYNIYYKISVYFCGIIYIYREWK